MKISNIKKTSFILTLSIVLVPVCAFAANDFWPIVQCDGVSKVCDFNAFVDMINRIINWFISIASSVAALTMAYAGAQILLNPGNSGKIEDAKKMFSKAVWGLVWLLGAWLIVHAVVSMIPDSQGDPLRFLKN